MISGSEFRISGSGFEIFISYPSFEYPDPGLRYLDPDPRFGYLNLEYLLNLDLAIPTHNTSIRTLNLEYPSANPKTTTKLVTHVGWVKSIEKKKILKENFEQIRGN